MRSIALENVKVKLPLFASRMIVYFKIMRSLENNLDIVSKIKKVLATKLIYKNLFLYASSEPLEDEIKMYLQYH